MGLVITLRDGKGTVLDTIGESWDTIPDALPESDYEERPLLSGVDRYGVTSFNRQQMRNVADELRQMLAGASARRAQLIESIVDLCLRAQDVVDAQLWFTGD